MTEALRFTPELLARPPLSGLDLVTTLHHLPTWTMSTTYRNQSGGVDVTQEVLASLAARSAPGAQPFARAAL